MQAVLLYVHARAREDRRASPPLCELRPPIARVSGTRRHAELERDLGFEQWGEILGDAMVAAALIDRLVHHAIMITLKGKSYRLRERGLDVAPAAQARPLRGST
jgi:IstB-like ATP binding protein